jgi:hypothetical protein
MQQLKGAILTIFRREIGVLESHLSVRATASVQPSDQTKTLSRVERPGSLWPLIGLAVGCWAVVGMLLHGVGLV